MCFHLAHQTCEAVRCCVSPETISLFESFLTAIVDFFGQLTQPMDFDRVIG